MRKLILILSSLAAVVAIGKTLHLETLTPYDHQDTEMTMHVAIPAGTSPVKSWSVSMDFVPASSNCLEIAFGRDSDTNGVLSVSEAVMAFGWDCGWWFLRGPEGTRRAAADPSCLGTRIPVQWQVIGSKRGPRSSRAEFAGESLWPDVCDGSSLPPWLFDRSWDLMKVTVRGVDGASERIDFETVRESFLFMVK